MESALVCPGKQWTKDSEAAKLVRLNEKEDADRKSRALIRCRISNSRISRFHTYGWSIPVFSLITYDLC